MGGGRTDPKKWGWEAESTLRDPGLLKPENGQGKEWVKKTHLPVRAVAATCSSALKSSGAKSLARVGVASTFTNAFASCKALV